MCLLLMLIRTRSCKQAVGMMWNGQQPGGQTLFPLDDKHKSSANQTPASKVRGCHGPSPPFPWQVLTSLYLLPIGC